MCATQYTPTATIVSSCCQLSPRTFTFSPGEGNVTIFCQFNLCITTSPDVKKEKIKLAGHKLQSSLAFFRSICNQIHFIAPLHYIYSTAHMPSSNLLHRHRMCHYSSLHFIFIRRNCATSSANSYFCLVCISHLF